MKCLKCGKEIKGGYAISRTDNKTRICSMCGYKEAMDAAVKFGAVSENEAEEILKAIYEHEEFHNNSK